MEIATRFENKLKRLIGQLQTKKAKLKYEKKNELIIKKFHNKQQM